MKKIVLIVAVVVLALGALGVGVVFAQDGTQPVTPGIVSGYSRGWMHDYVEQALAEKLGITEAQVEEQLAAGKTMVQIVLENGIAEDQVASFLTEVHTAAFDKAVADGVITREQADLMLERMQTRSFNYGTCPMYNSQTTGTSQTYGPGMMQNWRGGQGGQGGMMGGGRWQQP